MTQKYGQVQNVNLDLFGENILNLVANFISHLIGCYTSSSAIAKRDRAAGWVSYGQKWKTVNGRQYFTDIIGLSSTTMT